AQDHRMRQATLALQPEIRLPGDLRDRPVGEELGGDALVGGFLRHMLGAVLAELEASRFGWLGPGASRAVETCLLVQLAVGAPGAAQTHLARRVLDRRGDRADTAGGGGARSPVEAWLV